MMEPVRCASCGTRSARTALDQNAGFCPSCDHPQFWQGGYSAMPAPAEVIPGAGKPRYAGVKGIADRTVISCPHCSEPNRPARDKQQASARCHRCRGPLYPPPVEAGNGLLELLAEPKVREESATQLSKDERDWRALVLIAAISLAIVIVVFLLRAVLTAG